MIILYLEDPPDQHISLHISQTTYAISLQSPINHHLQVSSTLSHNIIHVLTHQLKNISIINNINDNI
jgi:hypothetical protein